MPDPDNLIDRNSNQPFIYSLRPEVAWFAWQMELQLRANDHKGGWQGDALLSLWDRLYEEADELRSELYALPLVPLRIVKEAVDVANFAMMVADSFRDAPDA